MSIPICVGRCLFMGTIHLLMVIFELVLLRVWMNQKLQTGGEWVVEPLDENESRFTKRLRGLIVTHPLRMMMMSRTRHFNREKSNSAPSQAQACCLLASYPHSGKAFVCHSNAAQLWTIQSVNVRDVKTEVAASFWLPHKQATDVWNAKQHILRR